MAIFSGGTLSPSLLFFLFLLFPSLTISDTPPYIASDLILINCGASANLTDVGHRAWKTDEQSSYLHGASGNISASSTASHMHPSVPDLVPYQTVRVFRSPFTYSFPVASSGHKFLRLYFYPDAYSGFDTSQSFFSLTANGYTLLSNFSAFLNSQKSNPSFIKEFILNVKGDPRIDLTFTPNPNSFAFINGIEIVSLPENLYFRYGPIKLVPNHLTYLENKTALETLYRLNVGGADVQIPDDTGMFRYWSQDDDYIFGADYGYTPHDESHKIQYTAVTPPYSAPKIVYQTSRSMSNMSKSLEWAFPVDSGFSYLLRFHFCEILMEITKQNQRVFTINVNQQLAELEADVIFWTGGKGNGIPIFKDYIVWVPNDGHHGKKDLRLSLFPSIDAQPMYLSATLNGLEVFKLSDKKQSLAAANPEPEVPDSVVSTQALVKKTSGKSCLFYGMMAGAIGIVAVVVAAASFLILRRRGTEGKDSIYYEVIRETSLDRLKS